MNVPYIIKNTLAIIVILIFINTASFSSDKTPGAVENNCVDVELYVEEEELAFEHWMIEKEQWETGDLQVNLVQQSQSENITELVQVDEICINLLIETQFEEELKFEPWMVN